MNALFANQDGLDQMFLVEKDYSIDIAMLIDTTASMAPIIDEVKANALYLYRKFCDELEYQGRLIKQFRIKVIQFRDYKYDGDRAINDSGFFVLPEQYAEFEAYVQGINASGGGEETWNSLDALFDSYVQGVDIEELGNSLEALALAMNSDWVPGGRFRRHVILLYTDASAVPLKDAERVASPYYPANMPNNLEELQNMWNGVGQYGMPGQRSKYLIVFTPIADPWDEMEEVWDNTWVYYYQGCNGLTWESVDIVVGLIVGDLD